MKITTKATRYIELINKSKLTASERKERASLKRTLTAYGLDPKHPRGLIDRAKIFDNTGLVQAFIEAARRVEHSDKVSPSAQKTYNELLQKLRKLGIEIVNYQRLQNILNELKQNAKAADRLKRSCKTRAPHKLAEKEETDIYADETDEENDVSEVPAEGYATA